MPIRSVQAHAPAFSITGEPVFPYRSARLPPASLRKSALRGDLPSGSLDRAYTLPGSLSKACPAPSPSLRIPIHYSRIFPFLQGGFANFQGRHQRLCLWTPQGSSSLDPFARLSCAFFHKICACCAGISRLRAQPPAATKIHPQRNEKPPRHTPQGDTFHLLEAAAFSGYSRFCSLRMQVK